MPRRVRFASACCCLLALLAGGPAAAWADDPATPSPSPDPTSTAPPPLPILPTPSASASAAPVGPATRLTLAVDSAGALAASWSPGAGDTAFTAAATVGGRTTPVETSATTASFPGMPADAVVHVAVTAHGNGADATPLRADFTMPSAIAPVTGATMHADERGLVLAWHPPVDAASGTRYLIDLVGADGSHQPRMVATDTVTFTGLARGHLYSARVTVVSGTSRSAAVDVAAVVWTAPTSAAPGVAPGAPAPVAGSAAPSATSVVTAAAQPTAERALVSSPLAAAALAAAAVLLGGLAIGLLLRRPSRS